MRRSSSQRRAPTRLYWLAGLTETDGSDTTEGTTGPQTDTGPDTRKPQAGEYGS